MDDSTIQSVTKKYLESTGLTYRGFAQALNESLRDTNVSHQSISNWEKAKNEPETDFLLVCMVTYSDWRMQFAIDMLCAKLPRVFQHGNEKQLMIG